MAVGKEIPSWLNCQINEEGLTRIQSAVAKAESQTTGEIIPMVVKSSTRTGSVPMILTLILFSLFLLIDIELDQKWLWMTPFIAILCWFVAQPLSKIPFILRFLTTPRDQTQDVHDRAELEFYRGRFHQTQKSTGILLFVSLFERRAVVLADKGISEKLSENTWTEVVQLLTAELKNKNMSLGFEKAVEKCGTILATHFPAEAINSNELSNQLVIKE